MRTNHRIRQPFWYALHGGIATETDEYGNEVGAHAEYGTPVKAYGNLSAAQGAVVARQFGDDDQYDRVILVEDRDTPIDENSVLWVDTDPESDEDYDYIVRRVARGSALNGTCMIAIEKVL